MTLRLRILRFPHGVVRRVSFVDFLAKFLREHVRMTPRARIEDGPPVAQTVQQEGEVGILEVGEGTVVARHQATVLRPPQLPPDDDDDGEWMRGCG